MSSIYPNSIDGYAQLPLVVDTVTQINADTVNRLRSAIVNIENELGIVPSGDSETVAVRLDELDASISTLSTQIAALDSEAGSIDLRVTALENDPGYTSYKEPCRVATTSDINFSSAPLVVDGVTLEAEDRILTVNQTDKSENGIYIVTSPGSGADGVWARSDDFDEATDIIQAGATTYVKEGDINQRTWYTLVTTGTIIIGTTNIEFIGGALIMRSDLTGADVIGSSATPQLLASADTYVSQSGSTDTRDYNTAVWYTTVTNKGTANNITVKIEWLEDGANLGPQGTEDIVDGASTLSIYEASYDISSETAPFNIPVIPLDVIGPAAKISVKSDVGITTEFYTRVWRKA